MRLRILLLCGLVSATTLLADDPFVGTWKLNVEKSKGGDPASLKAGAVSMKIEATGSANTYRETVERGGRNGKREEIVQTTPWNGTDQANDREGDVAGTYTTSVRRIDGTHRVSVFKKNGKEYQRSETSLSPDGKVETVHQSGTGRRSGKPFDYVLIYEKQQ